MNELSCLVRGTALSCRKTSHRPDEGRIRSVSQLCTACCLSIRGSQPDRNDTQLEDRSDNDMLYQGPNTTQNLVRTLVRFHKKQIAVSADVEEMFVRAMELRWHFNPPSWNH